MVPVEQPPQAPRLSSVWKEVTNVSLAGVYVRRVARGRDTCGRPPAVMPALAPEVHGALARRRRVVVAARDGMMREVTADIPHDTEAIEAAARAAVDDKCGSTIIDYRRRRRRISVSTMNAAVEKSNARRRASAAPPPPPPPQFVWR